MMDLTLRHGMATEHVPIKDAARRLAVSEDTIRRRIRKGTLNADLVSRGQVQIWMVEVPVDQSMGASDAVQLLGERAAGLERAVEDLRRERDAWREQAMNGEQTVRDLLALLQQVQASTSHVPAEAITPAERI
jgi:hypothetical protein